MSSKIILIAFGVLVALAVFAQAEQEENSLSENVAISREAREADPRRKMKKARNNKKKARRGKKKARKGKKKARKGKKKARKGKKKARKGKKKSRKNKGKRRGKKGTKKASRAAVVDADCVAQLTLSMRRWKDLVGNYKRQANRVSDNKDKGSKKADKKHLFSPVAHKLVSVGGGNRSALECGGMTTGAGAEKMTQLVTELYDCEKKVNVSCHQENFPEHPESRIFVKCDAMVEEFEKEADACMKLSKDKAKAAEGCGCWTSEKVVKLTEDVNMCKVTDHMMEVKAQLKACTTTFGACRKLEDEAVHTMSACSQNPDKLKQKAAALNKNKKALDDTKAKVAALKAGATSRRRMIRAPADDCAGIIVLVQLVVSLVAEHPSSPQVAVVGADVVASTGTCSADDVAALEALEVAVEEAADHVEANLEAAQADLESAFGFTFAPEALDEIVITSEGAETTSPVPEETTTMPAGSDGVSGGASPAARVMHHLDKNRFFKRLIKKVIA